MMSIKVSVVVPVYNQAAYLDEALTSLTQQTLQEAEFIIVNDGSTDESLTIIQRYASKDTRFVVIDKANGGVGLAINTGIDAARGEYIAELDSDDYVTADMYEKLYATAAQNDLDILKSNLVNFTGSGETYQGQVEQIARNGYYNRVIDPLDEKIILSFPMYAWVSLYRRELLIDNHIRWNEAVSSYNDNGFYWQTMSLAKRVMYVDETYIYHRRDNEMSTVKNPDKLFKNFFIEHDFIRENLTSRGLFEQVKPFFYERKINNYFFALKVIPFEKKQAFFQLIAQDFLRDKEQGGLDDVDFVNPGNQIKINAIVADPDAYFEEVYVPEFYKVSVIMPVHNAGKYLRRTLDSVTQQSLRDIEIILVENGSQDDTVEIIQDYVRKDPRISTVSIGPSNAGHARNVGLTMAHGTYLAFLDADDTFHSRMLEHAFYAGRDSQAQIVWFKSERKNVITGQTYVMDYAYNRRFMPEAEVFAFSELADNPYHAFNGWTWDKLFEAAYIRTLKLTFQEQPVSNDGYFTNIAMTNATRIRALNRTLVTQLYAHGNNISSTKHDTNWDNAYNMNLAIQTTIRQMPNSERFAKQYSIKNIRSIIWQFSEGFTTGEGARHYFDLLVAGGLEKLGVLALTEDDFDQLRDLKDWRFLRQMTRYAVGEYDRFFLEIGQFKFEEAKSKADITPNPKVQIKSAKLIFGQNEAQGRGKAARFFTLLIGHHDTSNLSAVIDVMYMDNFKPLVKDTLNLSISLQQVDGELQPMIHQLQWDSGKRVMLDHLYYSFKDNIFTIHAKYTGKYTGFSYQIRQISSREGHNFFSTTVNNQGYVTIPLDELTDLKPIAPKSIWQGVQFEAAKRVYAVYRQLKNTVKKTQFGKQYQLKKQGR
ncbi:MAG TPA: glycosyltransferase [Lactobacillaceae bacterium]